MRSLLFHQHTCGYHQLSTFDMWHDPSDGCTLLVVITVTWRLISLRVKGQGLGLVMSGSANTSTVHHCPIKGQLTCWAVAVVSSPLSASEGRRVIIQNRSVTTSNERSIIKEIALDGLSNRCRATYIILWGNLRQVQPHLSVSEMKLGPKTSKVKHPTATL